MTIPQFYKIFEFVCKMFYSFFEILLNIPLTEGINFGNILLFVLLLSFLFLILFKPLQK